MSAVSVLRELWRRRRLVALGFAIALTAGAFVAYKIGLGVPPTFQGRQYQVGIASAGALVDSPRSQVVDLGTGGRTRADVASLSVRARLLASLMAISPLKDQIALRAGVKPDALVASAPTEGPTVQPSPLDAGRVSDEHPDVRRLSVYVNAALPIITADAQAPTPAEAARISSAAVAELRVYLKSVAASDRVPDARRLVVDPLGPARFATVTRGPRHLLAAVAFLFAFGLWCAAIIAFSELSRGWRDASAAESVAAPPPPQLAEPGRQAPPAPATARRIRRRQPKSAASEPEQPDRSVDAA
ncbi:MAG: hypothetical protein QOG56_1235 [Solirubrobacteraceae bacterium]|nr:hypothetical protein [Solirubrobacteraceae bacterium]